MVSTGEYRARNFNLGALQGISDETLEMHFKLYEGYVKETNKLNEKIAEFVSGGKVDQEEFAEYSELNRRLGFESLQGSARCVGLAGRSAMRTR